MAVTDEQLQEARDELSSISAEHEPDRWARSEERLNDLIVKRQEEDRTRHPIPGEVRGVDKPFMDAIIRGRGHTMFGLVIRPSLMHIARGTTEGAPMYVWKRVSGGGWSQMSGEQRGTYSSES